jgi:hypothetical protein
VIRASPGAASVASRIPPITWATDRVGYPGGNDQLPICRRLFPNRRRRSPRWRRRFQR